MNKHKNTDLKTGARANSVVYLQILPSLGLKQHLLLCQWSPWSVHVATGTSAKPLDWQERLREAPRSALPGAAPVSTQLHSPPALALSPAQCHPLPAPAPVPSPLCPHLPTAAPHRAHPMGCSTPDPSPEARGPPVPLPCPGLHTIPAPFLAFPGGCFCREQGLSLLLWQP